MITSEIMFCNPSLKDDEGMPFQTLSLFEDIDNVVINMILEDNICDKKAQASPVNEGIQLLKEPNSSMEEGSKESAELSSMLQKVKRKRGRPSLQQIKDREEALEWLKNNGYEVTGERTKSKLEVRIEVLEKQLAELLNRFNSNE